MTAQRMACTQCGVEKPLAWRSGRRTTNDPRSRWPVHIVPGWSGLVMDAYTITIPGTPVGKGRPKFTRNVTRCHGVGVS